MALAIFIVSVILLILFLFYLCFILCRALKVVEKQTKNEEPISISQIYGEIIKKQKRYDQIKGSTPNDNVEPIERGK